MSAQRHMRGQHGILFVYARLRRRVVFFLATALVAPMLHSEEPPKEASPAPARLCSIHRHTRSPHAGPLCETLLYPACRSTLQPARHGFPPAMRCYGYGARSCACLLQCQKREFLSGCGASLWTTEQPRRASAFSRCSPHSIGSSDDSLSSLYRETVAVSLRQPAVTHAAVMSSVPPTSAPPPPPPCFLYCSYSNPGQHNCFARTGVADADQISDVPAANTPATFYEDSAMRAKIKPEDLRERNRGTFRIVPRSECPGGCSGEGECTQGGSCHCYPGFSGADCSTYTPDCFNGCSQRGTCIRGVCSCEFGWFGLDCSVQLSRRARLPGGGTTVMTDPPFGTFDAAPAPRPDRLPPPESQEMDRKLYNRLKARLHVPTPSVEHEGSRGEYNILRISCASRHYLLAAPQICTAGVMSSDLPSAAATTVVTLRPTPTSFHIMRISRTMIPYPAGEDLPGGAAPLARRRPRARLAPKPIIRRDLLGREALPPHVPSGPGGSDEQSVRIPRPCLLLCGSSGRTSLLLLLPVCRFG